MAGELPKISVEHREVGGTGGASTSGVPDIHEAEAALSNGRDYLHVRLNGNGIQVTEEKSKRAKLQNIVDFAKKYISSFKDKKYKPSEITPQISRELHAIERGLDEIKKNLESKKNVEVNRARIPIIGKMYKAYVLSKLNSKISEIDLVKRDVREIRKQEALQLADDDLGFVSNQIEIMKEIITSLAEASSEYQTFAETFDSVLNTRIEKANEKITVKNKILEENRDKLKKFEGIEDDIAQLSAKIAFEVSRMDIIELQKEKLLNDLDEKNRAIDDINRRISCFKGSKIDEEVYKLSNSHAIESLRKDKLPIEQSIINISGEIDAGKEKIDLLRQTKFLLENQKDEMDEIRSSSISLESEIQALNDNIRVLGERINPNHETKTLMKEYKAKLDGVLIAAEEQQVGFEKFKSKCEASKSQPDTAELVGTHELGTLVRSLGNFNQKYEGLFVDTSETGDETSETGDDFRALSLRPLADLRASVEERLGAPRRFEFVVGAIRRSYKTFKEQRQRIENFKNQLNQAQITKEETEKKLEQEKRKIWFRNLENVSTYDTMINTLRARILILRKDVRELEAIKESACSEIMNRKNEFDHLSREIEGKAELKEEIQQIYSNIIQPS